MNWRKRKDIVQHAYEQVAYYRDTFQKAGFHPEQLRSEDDWARVPILTRADLASGFGRLIAANADPGE